MNGIDDLKKKFLRFDSQKDLFSKELTERVLLATGGINSAGFDPWGLDPQSLARKVHFFSWLYTSYFRVETFGIDRIPQGRVMLVANHSGQLPFDALMIFLSLIKSANPPRIARSMVDYWVPSLPFISSFMNQGGAVVGSPRNCLDLLEGEQCVLVFPEGTRGLGKPYSKRYQLQTFGTGFLRLALEARAPIVPVAVVGAEEMYPGAFSLSSVGRTLGMPYFPISPMFLVVGLLAALPLPVRICLRFGPPLYPEGDPEMPDDELALLVEGIRSKIAESIGVGRKKRGWKIF
jgi:1-acyl-sn-glycerol-3-phosphate acyltransferase